MPEAFFILAGPQCAGKSTAKSYLYARHMRVDPGEPASLAARHNLVILQEMRQHVMHERGIHSGIFIDAAAEHEIIRQDLARMDGLLASGDDQVYLDETNVFTLAHAEYRGLDVKRYLGEYRARLLALDAVVLFLDLCPSHSWERRRRTYRSRVAGFPRPQAHAVMRLYRQYMVHVHDRLDALKTALDLPIHVIDAAGPLEVTLETTALVFQRLARDRRVTLWSRF